MKEIALWFGAFFILAFLSFLIAMGWGILPMLTFQQTVATSCLNALFSAIFASSTFKKVIQD